MTVIVNYELSPAGQRASLIAGGSGAARQTVTMEATPADLASPHITIAASGELSLAIPGRIDAPPATLADALALVEAVAEADIAAYEAGGPTPLWSFDPKERYPELIKRFIAARERRRADAENRERAGRVERLRQLAPDASLGALREITTDRALQVEALGEDRIAAAEAAAAAAAEAAAAAKAKEARELAADMALPIWYFRVEGGLCGFQPQDRVSGAGEKLHGWLHGWASYDQKHWLGVFTEPRGISRFLSGPRGEQCYDVATLTVGDCIQQASFRTNARGKRRDEDENFAVVVSVQPYRIGIHVCSSRAEALKFASKL